MGLPLEGSRSGCALQGALYAAQAIQGVVPILHATSGCGIQAQIGALSGGWSGSCAVSSVASSNISEKQVVFGGSSRLREQIKNTVKVQDGQLYIVLSGCATEMVGDDIPAMVKEAKEQGFPVISIATPGFRGSAYRGYELFLRGVVSQLENFSDTPAETIPGLINILGVVPVQDAHWEGNLEQISALLGEVGLTANTLFGQSSDIKGLVSLKQAQLSLVFSSWGLEAARELETRFGIPWIRINSLPVGAQQATRLLEVLAGKLSLNVHGIKKVSENLLQRENYFLNKLSDSYFQQGWQREFALVAPSSIAPDMAKFLTDTLGLLPSLVVITDNPGDQVRDDLKPILEKLLPGFETQVLFSEDRGEIHQVLREKAPGLVLGSALEQKVAQGLNVQLVEVSFPVTGQLLLEKTHVGTKGALTLIEDISRAILAGKRVK